MSLLIELHNIAKKDMPKVHGHNFVAKHATRAGAGAHADKKGEKAARSRQKREWKRDVHHD